TTSCMAGSVRVHDGDAYPAPADGRDHGTQRLGGTAAAPDHRAQVLGVYPHLQPLAAATVDHPHPYLVRVVDDPLDQVLQRRPECRVSLARRHRHPWTPWLRRPWPPSSRPWSVPPVRPRP